MLGGGHPLNLEVFDYLGLRHADSYCLRHSVFVCLNFRWIIRVLVFWIEERSSILELLDVMKLVNYVQIQYLKVSTLEVMGANEHVAILVTHAHVPEARREELDLELAQNLFRFAPEDSPHRTNLFKSFEMLQERMERYRGATIDADGKL